MTIILVLFAIVFARKGISTDALALKGMPSAGSAQNSDRHLAFVGFESAASLGSRRRTHTDGAQLGDHQRGPRRGVLHHRHLAQTTGFQGAKVGFDSAPAPLFDLAGSWECPGSAM